MILTCFSVSDNSVLVLKLFNLFLKLFFVNSCAIHDDLCELFCPRDSVLDLCNVRNIGR